MQLLSPQRRRRLKIEELILLASNLDGPKALSVVVRLDVFVVNLLDVTGGEPAGRVVADLLSVEPT